MSIGQSCCLLPSSQHFFLQGEGQKPLQAQGMGVLALRAAQGAAALRAPLGMAGLSQLLQERPDATAVLLRMFGDRIRCSFIRHISRIFHVGSQLCAESAGSSGAGGAWFLSVIREVEEEESSRLDKGSHWHVTCGPEPSFRPAHRKGCVLGITHSSIFPIESPEAGTAESCLQDPLLLSQML